MSAVLMEGAPLTPVDLEEMRTRYAARPNACPKCAVPYTDAVTLVCLNCWVIHIPDPSVLALCDEVEALRARVPEVLREWPKTVEDAPGEWAHFTADEGIRAGRFLSLPHMGGHVVVFERTNNRTIRLPDAFRPGEFFVRVP